MFTFPVVPYRFRFRSCACVRSALKFSLFLSVCRSVGLSVCLTLGALLLASCDSGADFSSLDDLSSDNASVARVRAWYDAQMEDAALPTFAGKSSDDDSLALAALVEKFPPDWNKAVLLNGVDKNHMYATTLGQYTDEKYDTTYYHIRTILFHMDDSGDVESVNIIVFSSRDELRKDGFDTYLNQYLAKDFGDVEMIVSRYTIGFEAVDAFLYRSGQNPLELSITLTKEEISSSGKLGKLGANASITGPDIICYEQCYLAFGRQCNYVGSPPRDPICTVVSEVLCVDVCYETSGGGGGGGDSTTGGGGGGGSGSGDGDGEDEDDCFCSNQEQCDLADEYSSGEFTCSDFRNNHGDMVVHGPGTENGKHGSYGYIHSQLPVAWGGVRSFVRSQGVNNTVGINSGYRCPTGNAQVNDSASGSRHKTGRGLDIQIYDANVWTETLKADIVEFNQEQYPNSDTYAADRRPAEGKTGHVHISI